MFYTLGRSVVDQLTLSYRGELTMTQNLDLRIFTPDQMHEHDLNIAPRCTKRPSLASFAK